MSDKPQDEDLKRAQEQRLLKTWATPKGWAYLSAVNNTEVGLWYYTLGSFTFLLLGGLLALLMRLQLAVPGNDLLGPQAYNQVFTMHGSVMMFLVAVPFLEAVAIYFLPQFMGTRDLPFPRLSAYGFWCYLIGGTCFFASLFFLQAPSGGWFMYPPLTGSEFSVGVEVEATPRQLMKLAVETPYSSLPVFTGADDRPVGMLHARDVTTHFVTTGNLPTPREIMRPLVVVLDNLPGDRLLATMRERQARKLIVIDEFGTLRGLVTLDDVLSVLVGGVADEYKGQRPQPEPLPDGRIRLPGILRLEDAAQATGLTWTSEASTVAGYVITALERIPAAGERLEVDGIDIEIERMDGPAIGAVLVTPASSGAPADAEVH